MTKKKELTFEEIVQNQLLLAQQQSETVWALVDEEIPDPAPLLLYKEKPVIFNNTKIVIQGKPGTHKSRFSAALVSLLLSGNISTQLYGFSKATNSTCNVLYIDSERNINHELPLMLKQIIKDSGVDKDALKQRLMLLPFTGVERDKRLFVLGRQISILQGDKTIKNHLVIVLDIITDMVRDFNSVESTNLVNDVMNMASNQFDATFIIIIHENPGESEKARGHVGTEITNKASTIFQIAELKTMKGVYRIQMLKSRTTEKYDEVLLKFDSKTKNLVIVTDDDIIAKAGDPDAYKLGLALAKKMFSTIERKELIEYLENELGWKERKIEEKLKLFVEKSIPFETLLGTRVLTKERGQKTVYQKVPVELPKDETIVSPLVPVPNDTDKNNIPGEQETSLEL
jgi:hypothetical protein